MKKLFLTITMVALTLTTNAQKQKFTDVYDMTLSVDDAKKKYKANVIAKSIKLEDGSIIKLGDTLQVGASANKISNNYTTLMVGRYSTGAVALGVTPVYYSLTIKNDYVVLEKIRVFRSMGRITIVGDLKQTNVSSSAMYKYVGALDMKVALSEGELINPNAPMTRSQAITKLKEAKELFELDMMTEQEYLEIKKEVTPIIKNK